MMIQDLLSETLLSLTANKGRSALTILGIVIGITSVIVMVAFGQGTKASITAEVSSMGANLLTITPGGSSGRGCNGGGTGSNTKSLTRGGRRRDLHAGEGREVGRSGDPGLLYRSRRSRATPT